MVVISALAVLGSSPAYAHWCSNIFQGHARLIVKPETTTVYLSSTPTPLRVYLQNNFPYAVTFKMRGSLSGGAGYVYPTPASKKVYPGQNVSFLFSLTGSGTKTLTLQVDFRVGNYRGPTDMLVKQDPSQSNLISSSGYPSSLGQQSGSLNAATLKELYPSATLSGSAPYFGRTGIQQLIHWFGYPYCYKSGGSWQYFSSQQCPTSSYPGVAWSSVEQFAQNCMRAGVGVAALKSKLGSDLTYARTAVTNALSNSPSNQHRCLAAVVGAYLFQGASSGSFTTALNASSMPTACKNAGLRVLNGTNSSSCPSSLSHHERAACAAAEGLRNNNGPVTGILMPNAGDGQDGAVSGYNGLYYSYMLHIVQAYRRATTGYVPFYPDAGVPSTTPKDGSAPPPDKAVPTPDKAVPTPDKAVPKQDKSVPKTDTSTPKQDTTAPTGDTSGPTSDTISIFDGIHVDVPAGGEAGTNTFEPTLEGGCGCIVGPGQRPVAGLLLFGFALLALVIRRR